MSARAVDMARFIVGVGILLCLVATEVVAHRRQTKGALAR